MTEIYSQSTK